MKHFFAVCAVILAILIVSKGTSARALVDMNSASYSVVWTDVSIDEPRFQFVLVRVYKSRSLHAGIFGLGSCSMLETQLSYISHDEIVATECGDGSEVLFYREGAKPSISESPGRRSERYTPALKRAGFSDEELKDLEASNDLGSDRSVLGRNAVRLPYGSFRADDGGRLTVTPARAIWTGTTGADRQFDSWGRLTQFRSNNNVPIAMQRLGARKWRLSGGGHAIDFLFDDAVGRYVTEVLVDGVSKARYSYVKSTFQGTMLLSRSKNQWPGEYVYSYNNYLNLTRVVWPDGTNIVLSYDNVRDFVTSFTNRDGCTQNYTYAFGDKIPPGYQKEAAEIFKIGAPLRNAMMSGLIIDRLHYSAGVWDVCAKAKSLYIFQHGEQAKSNETSVHRIFTALYDRGHASIQGYSSPEGETLRIESPLNVLWRESTAIKAPENPWVAVGEWGAFRKVTEAGCTTPKRLDGLISQKDKRVSLHLEFDISRAYGVCSIKRSVITIDGARFSYTGSMTRSEQGELDFSGENFLTHCFVKLPGDLSNQVRMAIVGAGGTVCTPAERAALVLAAVRSWGWL